MTRKKQPVAKITSLKNIVQRLDWCTITRQDNRMTIEWHRPTDRDDYGQGGLDPQAITRLVKAGYVEWRSDGTPSQYLSATERGQTVVLYYRPASQRQPEKSGYRHWLTNIDNTIRRMRYVDSLIDHLLPLSLARNAIANEMICPHCGIMLRRDDENALIGSRGGAYFAQYGCAAHQTCHLRHEQKDNP